MKIVIIGNGIAGQIVAQNIRKKDKDFEIVMISKEIHPYYSRIYLPNYIAGNRTRKQLYQRDLDWYNKNDIQLLLNTEVEKIEPKKKSIELEEVIWLSLAIIKNCAYPFSPSPGIKKE